MLIGEKVFQKDFINTTTKGAYLDACKWVSTKVIAVNNSQHIVHKIEKVETDDKFEKKVRLTLYAVTDEEEINEQNCAVCRETNNLFYMKQDKHMCCSCRVNPYRERMKNKLKAIIVAMSGRFY